MVTVKRLLIIDDDEQILRMLARLLSPRGFVVTVCSTPFGATNLAVETRPDLLVIDYEMPALKGPSLVDVMRRHPACQHIPVLLYSGADIELLRAAVRRGSADDFVQKSSTLEVLVGRIDRLLAQRNRATADLNAEASGRTPQPR